jgi:signal transduction histidine kinase
MGIGEHVFVLRNGASSHESFWVVARRTLLLAHLSLSRAYPWLLLAPYVFWAASRFSLEREYLRRRFLIQASLAAGFVFACQVLNQRVTAGRPMRLIVAVTETSSRGLNADGTPRETVTRFRKELRVTAPEFPESPPGNPLGQLGTGTNRERNAESGPLEFPEGLPAWAHEFAEGSGPVLPFELFWRVSLPSVALDLFVFVSLCGLGHAAHFRRRFQERERRAATLESSLARARLHTLQAQLQPHFLFNTLNSITALVRQNPTAAEEMLTSLSDLLRLALNQANQSWSSLRQELHFLRLYLDIQQMRFGDRLRYVEDADPTALDCAVPSLLLQPLVENAVRHGLEPAHHAGTVRVRARADGESLELSVEDDGVGCPGLVQGTARLGVGLTNVRDRLQALFERDASLTFAAGGSGGLAVQIRLPLRRAGSMAESRPYEDSFSHC